ncbi:MAG: MgtC/SapB family protein [Betaproteobacteria bacterium]|nr:MgtC/SapB family protein [Betaproteobacteria bacterium]
MEFFGASAPQHLDAFVTSLGIGLLLGLERERHTDPKAGLRTFALVALLGTLGAMLGEKAGSGWVLALGLITVAGIMIAANLADPSDDGDPGTTSVVALMVCYCLGATVWFGHATLAVMLAITSTALLYFKAELHGFTHNLTHKDLISIIQFAVLTFIVLPILPDNDYGPYAALNPHQIWLMVVLIAGVSLAGYAALRFVGARHGAAVIGLFGGMASSTATTMVFARHARMQSDLVRTATVVVLLANLVVMLRLAVISVVVAPKLALPLTLVLGSGLLLGLAVTAYGWRSLGAHGELPMPEVTNPTELRTALSFGLLYAVVLLCSAWLEDIAGSKGLYMVALISGLTDVDAITLSSLHLFNLDKLDADQTVTSIALAIGANLLFKTGLVIVIGGAALARHALPGLCAIGLGLWAGSQIFA